MRGVSMLINEITEGIENGKETKRTEKKLAKAFGECLKEKCFFSLPFRAIKRITRYHVAPLTKPAAAYLLGQCSQRYGPKALELLKYITLESIEDNTVSDLLMSINGLPIAEQLKKCALNTSSSEQESEIESVSMMNDEENYSSVRRYAQIPKSVVVRREPEKKIEERKDDVEEIQKSFLAEATSNIQEAVKLNDVTLVKKILKKNASKINEKDDHQYTPIHNAAKFGCSDAAKILLKYNANPNEPAINGRTPLHLSAISGHSEVLEILAQAGGNVNIQDNNGATPLHFAVSWNKLDTIQTLINLGASTRIRNNKGETALAKCKTAAARDLFNGFINKVPVI